MVTEKLNNDIHMMSYLGEYIYIWARSLGQTRSAMSKVKKELINKKKLLQKVQKRLKEKRHNLFRLYRVCLLTIIIK